MDKVTLGEQNLHYPWCHVTPCTSYTYPFPFLLTVISFHIFSPPLRKFSLFKQLLKPVFFDSITTLWTLLIAKWTTQLIWISISRNYLQCLQTLINEMVREHQFYYWMRHNSSISQYSVSDNNLLFGFKEINKNHLKIRL